MKKYFIPLILATAFLTLQINIYGQDIVHSIPAPGIRCQDVAWDGTNLWVTDNVTRMYYKIEPENGSVLHQITFPAQSPYSEGITFDGQYLWANGWQESNGEGSKIFKIDTETGDILESFDYPEGTEDNWPHGLTFDGTHLWANNFNTNTLDKIDPSTGNLLTTLPAPGSYSVGIAWDGHFLWTDDFHQGKIFKQDPLTGEILGEEYIMMSNMRGLTWDGEYLWCVSWEDQMIYKIDVGPLRISEEERHGISLYPNPSSGKVYLQIGNMGSSFLNIQVFNLQGKMIKDIHQAVGQTGIHSHKLDMTGLPDGMYMLRMNASGKTWSEKIILKR